MPGQPLSKRQIEILEQRMNDDKRHFDARKLLNQAIFEEARKRKPVQIATTYIPEGEPHDSGVDVTVLCSDGSIWSLDHRSITGWFQLPPIPQPEEKE